MSNALAKQIGPLPLGVWLGVGAGGLALAYFINKRMAVNAATASKEPSTTQLTESGVGLGGGQMIYNPPVTGSADATPENNSSWGIKATNWLVSKGIVATDADQAIRKYLSSLPLSATERGMVNLVIGQFGVPPEPLPPTEGVDPETPPETKVAPNAPTGLHVAPATRRNDIVWVHDGQNVTHFFVQAKVRVNGSTITAQVGAYPLPNTYVWSHFLDGSITTNYTVDYLVVAWNGNVMGGEATTASNFRM